MDEAPDLTSLARRCLDLWQEQVSALAGDPAVAAEVARLLGLLEGGAAAWWQVVASRGKTDGYGAGTATSTGPAGSAAAPLSPAAGGDDLARLAARLAALEERLARLESGPARKPRGAGGSARPGRPRRPRGGDR